jgi:hypothetical protein
MSTEEHLGRTLRAQADGIDEQPLTLGDVRGRARRIRRRQASGVAAGVALVAAVALPIALLSGSGGNHSDPEPATPSPSRAVDPFADGVPTLQDGVIVYQDGPRIPLPQEIRDTADGFAVLGADRYVVTRSAGNDREGVLVSDVGAVLGRFRLFSGITPGPDGTSIAWVAPDRTLHLLVAGSDEPRTIALGDVRPTQTTAITGDCADTCTIAVRTARGGELGGTVLVTSDGEVSAGPAAVPAVVDISPNGSLIAGLDSVADDDTHLCGGVYNVAADDYAWPSCEHNVYNFSPDGALVATTFGEGRGPTRIDIRDARSGEAVAGAAGGWISSWAWEDSTHLLAVQVRDDGKTSLLRISAERATTVLDGFTTASDDLSPPIILPFD